MCTAINFITSKGRYHSVNEDSYYIGENFLIVADGMGGVCDGNIASKIAVDTVAKILSDMMNFTLDDGLKELMFAAITKAEENIFKYVDKNPGSYGMGTTILIMIYRNGGAFFAWCGDSRCYSFNEGKLCSLTKDHSYVQELIDAHKITTEESFSHPDNNLITRFVGGDGSNCNPEYIYHPIKNSEIIILCSDGLSGYCRDSDIEGSINSTKKISSLPVQLKDLAIQHGSDDDITIVTFSLDSARHENRHSSLKDWFCRKK